MVFMGNIYFLYVNVEWDKTVLKAELSDRMNQGMN